MKQQFKVKSLKFKVKTIHQIFCVVWVLLLTLNFQRSTAFSAQPMSLFHGLVVAEGSPGAKVVIVAPLSFADEAGLLAGDIITQVDEEPIQNIDQFASASQARRGVANEATLTVQRQGEPVTIRVTVFSRTLEDVWGERFVPDRTYQFKAPRAGFEFWFKQAQRHIAQKQRLDAITDLYNALHHQPSAIDDALLVAFLWLEEGDTAWAAGRKTDAFTAFKRATRLYQRAAQKDLNSTQWATLQSGLRHLHTILANYVSRAPHTS